jgi:hypothetical protein
MVEILVTVCIFLAGGLLTIFGMFLGGQIVPGSRLDKSDAVREAQRETIDAKDKTIGTLERQVLLLEATANATLSVLNTVKGIAQGGVA